MEQPQFFWKENPQARLQRVAQQDSDRSSCTNDHAEFVYTADLDEVFAELLRLHRKSREPRTRELIERVFRERAAELDLDAILE
jgi:hypothetical protein